MNEGLFVGGLAGTGCDVTEQWSLFHVHLEGVTFGRDFAAKKPFHSKGGDPYSLQSPATIRRLGWRRSLFKANDVTTSLECSVDREKMWKNPETYDWFLLTVMSIHQ